MIARKKIPDAFKIQIYSQVLQIACKEKYPYLDFCPFCCGIKRDGVLFFYILVLYSCNVTILINSINSKATWVWNLLLDNFMTQETFLLIHLYFSFNITLPPACVQQTVSVRLTRCCLPEPAVADSSEAAGSTGWTRRWAG